MLDLPFRTREIIRVRLSQRSPFDWRILLRNGDATLPALVGLLVAAEVMRRRFLAGRQGRRAGTDAPYPVNDAYDREGRRAGPDAPYLVNDAYDRVPFKDLIDTEYRLVYLDPSHRLYAHRTISKRPE
jgi:hypothetical protein